MGLFDKFKNKKKSEENTEPAVSFESPNETEAHAANDNRRFFYVVEDKFAMKNENEVVVVGDVHGTIRVGDAIYILQPNGTTTLSMVKAMERMIEGTMLQMQTATDTHVSLLLEMKKEDIAIFSVITSIRPQFQVDVKHAVENPAVAALMYGLPKYSGNNEFFNWLMNAIAHGHYITPIQISKEITRNEDGTATAEKGATIGFSMLRNPKNPAESVMPIFTDWTELHKWEKAPKNEHGNVETMILRFQDVVTVTKPDSFGGFVINPFSQNQMFVTKQLIQAVVSSEGYQREFVQNDGSNVHAEKIEKDTKVMLGVPNETEEVKHIRSELALYGEKNAEIDELHLLLQMKPNGEKTYIVYVDCNSDNAKWHFENMNAVIRNYAVKIPSVGFVLKGQVSAYDEVLGEKSLVYSAK